MCVCVCVCCWGVRIYGPKTNGLFAVCDLFIAVIPTCPISDGIGADLVLKKM